MTPAETRSHYRKYIEALNTGGYRDLKPYVNDEVTYNGRKLTRADYENMLANDHDVIPDLYFHIDLLVVEGGDIACKLDFNCTPVKKFLGMEPNGKKISFSEHVFYRLRNGRISEVRSLIDRDAVARQFAE